MVFEREIPSTSLVSLLEQYLRRSISEILREINNSVEVDYIVFRLEQVCSTLVRASDLADNSREYEILTLLRSALSILQSNPPSSPSNELGLYHTGRPGRPSVDIPMETLSFLLELGFKVTEIADMFSVNARTIHRRLEKFNLGTALSRYTCISDDELDGICRDILEQFPNCGFRRMRGFLRVRDVHITWKRTMETMKRVDPEGVTIRSLQLNITHRRVYSVRGPLSLWHIDGNHKLIR